jgi:hypothetical protein
MKKILLLLAVAIPLSLYAQKGEELSFLVYGRNHTVNVVLPDTWNVNMELARSMGGAAFFHLRAYSPNESPAGLFMILKGKNPGETLESWAAEDTPLYARDLPGSAIEKLDWAINRKDSAKVLVYRLRSPGSPIVLYTAYIDTEESFFVNFFMQLYGGNQINAALLEENYRVCLEKTAFLGWRMQTR